MAQFTTCGMVVFAACLTWPGHADNARPAVVVPASSDRAVVTVHLADIDKPEAKDIEAGTLVNSQYPDQRIVPKVTPTAISGKDKDWDLTLTVEQLLPFGDSIVPLLYKGEQKQTLRFFKAGLVPKPLTDGGFSVREGSPLLIVLENPTASDYSVVRVRLRFQNVEVCRASADKFVAAASNGDNSKCDDPNQWASFSVPKYAPITLRVPPAPEWFRDPQTGFPQGAKRKGVLNLRFQGDSANGTMPPIYKQSVPLEVQFDPGDSSIGWSLFRVTFWLLVGALLALILRVTIPNYRRQQQLKAQLRKAEKATRTISDEVDSMLRVLLHVERLAVDQLRRSAWISEPSYSEIAQRVEQGLATLQRKIGYARRLDNAKWRRAMLMDETIAPTRLNAIDTQLNLAGQALMRDQISDQDWVFIQQRLEASDKLLGEPTQEEKDALDALLVQRWKSIRDFYVKGNHELRPLPKELDGMDACFPAKADLPKETDDGSQWVKEVGSVRADLKLTSLSLVREFYFFEPSKEQKSYWDDAKTELADLLSTPAIEDLTAARLLLSELAEEVQVKDICDALMAEEAEIEVDPQFVAPYEKTRLTVRFRKAA